MRQYVYIIDKSFDGWNIREYLEYFSLSKSKINTIINENKYYINYNQSDNVLHTNDVLLIDDIFHENEVEPIYNSFYNVDVAYLDKNILVVDKPRNIIIHSDNPNEVTLDRIVAGIMIKNGFDSIPRHTSRLDKNTCGLVCYALDPLTFSKLNSDVESKTLKKTYYAIINKVLENKTGVIDKPIGRDRHQNGKMIISPTGKPAKTFYKVLNSQKGFSILKVELQNGRTHQIRLHLSSISAPIVGDELYGSPIKKEMMLQCAIISLTNPVNKKNLTINVKNKLSLDRVL